MVQGQGGYSPLVGFAAQSQCGSPMRTSLGLPLRLPTLCTSSSPPARFGDGYIEPQSVVRSEREAGIVDHGDFLDYGIE
jgi:hypothetical protein